MFSKPQNEPSPSCSGKLLITNPDNFQYSQVSGQLTTFFVAQNWCWTLGGLKSLRKNFCYFASVMNWWQVALVAASRRKPQHFMEIWEMGEICRGWDFANIKGNLQRVNPSHFMLCGAHWPNINHLVVTRIKVNKGNKLLPKDFSKLLLQSHGLA